MLICDLKGLIEGIIDLLSNEGYKVAYLFSVIHKTTDKETQYTYKKLSKWFYCSSFFFCSNKSNKFFETSLNKRLKFS